MLIVPQKGESADDFLARAERVVGLVYGGEAVIEGVVDGSTGEESRAYCPTGEGNGIDNSCSSSATGSSATKAVLKAVTQNVSHDDLTALVATAIGTKKGWFTKPEKGEISPSRLCRDCGIQNINSEELDQIHSTARQSDREGIASAIAGVLTYAQKDPSILKAKLSVDTIYTISKKSGESAFSFVGTGAMYSPIDDTIHVLTSASLTSMQRAHERGFIAGSGMDYVIAHEHAHKMHYDELAKSSPRPSDKSQMDEWRYNALASSTNAVVNRMNTDAGFRSVIEDTLPKISQYATSDPFEAYAEYSAAVRLGLMKNDSGMDDFCRTVGGPVPKRIKK